MERVTGIGGIFFKSDDPAKLCRWYQKHLGIQAEPPHGTMFEWKQNDGRPGGTAWSIFPRDTKYFDPSRVPFMVNYRVDDLDALLEALRAEGVWIDPKREDSDYGRFAWIMDPDGNRIELWEPPKNSAP